jgi:hypothetical protein
MLWACQSVAFMISARVAPFARPIISKDLSALAPGARGAGVLGCGKPGGFLRRLGTLLRSGCLGFAALGGFPALRRGLLPRGGVPGRGLLRRDVRARPVRQRRRLYLRQWFLRSSWSPSPFCSVICACFAQTIHRSSWLGKQVKSSGKNVSVVTSGQPSDRRSKLLDSNSPVGVVTDGGVRSVRLAPGYRVTISRCRLNTSSRSCLRSETNLPEPSKLCKDQRSVEDARPRIRWPQ